LTEAVRLEDVEEIKLRFVNDEDVNKSRSYLIYTVAMSEKEKLSITRLEIAQLYIHCGADDRHPFQ
jgi:chloramphenicol O-acetyltransferase